VIVSGGDPLTLPTEKIDYILSMLSDIKSIEVIRIGTRAPVVFPQRIDDNLCKVLEKYENLWLNTQFNHPSEITTQSILACKRLQRCGIVISNQSVLLKGVNDNVGTMLELCHKLQNIRVRPYYLYQCDPVVGAHHFRTSIWRGIDILENMRGHTSGMCIPTFVVDGIDGKGKIPINPNYVLSVSPDGLTLRNYKNETLFYFNPKE
jgi:lysine 2,3-aminomutase